MAMTRMVMMRPFSVLLLLLLTLRCRDVRGEDQEYGTCDEDSMDDSVPLSMLTPNQFHKICPKQISGDLGQPICGDGTPFSFFVSKPIQRKANKNKILIEFMGGGACWDYQTCTYNDMKATFPEELNAFVGYSCSEIAYSMANLDGYPISMLCSRSIGDTDFSEYTTIVIPYCTQDVHVGDSTMTYDDITINHHGGHNTMSVLRWIFRNFQHPTHIALTGCSAGGTVVPVAYDFLRKHYNRYGRRNVQISTIADSPTYLTPTYFLENYFENWNPSTVMNRIGFNFNRWRYSGDYPTRVWGHVLKRGSNKDKWAFVSHTDDPISLAYFQWMSGQGDNQRQRRLADDDGSSYNSWYSEITSSLKTIENKHRNVDNYWVESEGHCSFGLYYPLYEDGEYFEEWAAPIVKEQRVHPKTPAFALFLLSAVLGTLMFYGAYNSDARREINLTEGGYLEEVPRKSDEDMDQSNGHPIVETISACTSCFASYPVTAAYGLAITIYFWTMVISQGFAHPVNNPSVGPSATGLSDFGINNPSLIVYNFQIFRLVTSSFLCSGVLTYFIVLLCLAFFVRPLEKVLNNSQYFATVSLLILFGTNIFYAMVANGASCSSVALVFGLNTVYIILCQRLEDSSIVGMTVLTTFLNLLVCLLFPFNSWIMCVSGVGMGIFTATFVVQIASKEEPHMLQDDGLVNPNVHTNPVKLSSKALVATGGFLLFMAMMLVFRIRKPNELYLEPFYTGCNIMYAAGEDVSDLVSNYQSSGRYLKDNGNNEDDLCAQFCVPHIASNAAVYGTKRILDLTLKRGQCQDLGYDQHMADKTFAGAASYSMDFEIFTMTEDDGEN